MARLFTTGFELGSVATGVEFQGVSGVGSSIQTVSGTLVRTGLYSNKIAPVSNYCGTQQKFASTGKTVAYGRFYFKYTTSMSANGAIFSISDSSGNNLGSIYMGTDNKLGILYWIGTTPTYSSTKSAALTNGQWYRVEIKVDTTNANQQVVTALLDGTQFDTKTGTATQAANSAYTAIWGAFFSGSDPSGTAVLYFDDIAVNDGTGTVQNTYPGAGKVIMLKPAGAGESAGWTRAGTDSGANWSQCNTTPPNDATAYVLASTLNAKDMYSVTSSGLDSTHAIKVVEVGGRINRSQSTSPTMKFRLIKQSGGTEVLSNVVQPSTTAWVTNASVAPFTSPLVTYADPDGSDWTYTTLGTMQIGMIETVDTNRNIMVSEVWSMVDYTTIVSPSLSTSACGSVAETTAVGNGDITDTGGVSCTRRGFCYMTGTSGDPTTANSVAYDDGTFSAGTYTKSITGLLSATNYRVRAYAVNSAGTGYGTTVQLTTLNYSPTTVLSLPTDTDTLTDSTPTFVFTGTDPESNGVEYNIQIDTVNTFDSGNLVSKFSVTDTGFLDYPDEGDTHPFISGTAISYTVQTPLTGSTYYWRVAAKDPAPSGSDAYGAWATTRSFTLELPFAVSGTSDQTSGTVSVAVNNTLQGQTGTIGGDGSWTISGVTKPSSGDSITVFISSASSADVSTAFTTYSGTSAIGGMVLNRHVLSIGSDQNRSIVLSDLANYDYDQDTTHILHSANGSPATLLMKYANGSSYVDEKLSILSGNTLTIGATETLTAFDVTIGGTMVASGAATLNVARNWTNSGTFTAGSSTVTLNGTVQQTLSGILNSTSAFYNLTITNNSGTSPSDNERTGFTPSVDFNAAAKVTNDYTITTANTRVEYESGATYEFQNINWDGQSTSSRIVFRNSATSGTWLLKVTGGQTAVASVDVSRSDASVSGGISIFAGSGTNDDSTNNTNWIFSNTRLRQEVNIINSTYSAAGDSNEIVYIDPAKYDGTLAYKFEIVAMVTSGTGTVTLHDSSNNIHATISVSNTSFERQMVYCSTAPTVDRYHVNLSGGTGLSVQAARVIIIQDIGTGEIEATETQVEIGNNETSKNNTSSAPLTYPKYWYYDSAKWSGTISYYAEVAYASSNASGSVTVTLQKDNAGDLATWSDVITVVNAQVQTVPTLSSRVTFTPVSGCNYRIASYISSGSYAYSVYGAKVIVDQSGGSGLSGSIANISTILYAIDCTATGGSNIFGVVEASQRGIFVKPDGTRGYFLTNTTKTLYQADFGTAWDMSTAVYNSDSYSLSTLTSVYAPFFKPDGTKLYLLDDTASNQNIYQYSVSTAWDLGGTITSDKSQPLPGIGAEYSVKGLYITADGMKAFVSGATRGYIYAFDFGTAWDIATLSYVGVYSPPAITPTGVWFAPNGMKMYVCSATDVFQYTLTTAWTITSGVTDDGIWGDLQDNDTAGIFFSPDMTKLYSSGAQDDKWTEFNSGVSYATASITKIEPQYLIQNTYKNTTGLQNYDTLWSPSDWQGLSNAFYHEINISSDTADSAKLQYDPNGTPTDVTNSSATGTAYRSRSSALTLPTTTQTIDTNISNTPVYASKIIATTIVPSPPTLTSPTATSVTIPTATLGATITSDGGLTITARGTCWGTSPNPTTNALAEGGTSTGAFSHSRTGITKGVVIYYRGYATNSKGTSYSEDGILIPGPNDAIQFDSDHETILMTGDSTTNTSVFLDFSVATLGSTETATPKVELRSLGSAFTGTSTHSGDSFNMSPSVPRFRVYPATVYDSANSRLVAFGGKDDGGVYLNNTWELKLPTSDNPNPIWRLMSPTGTPPSGRTAMVYVYDSVGQRLIIFGGTNGAALGGFYSLDLSTTNGAWSTFDPAGTDPANRFTSAGIFDATNRRMIIFGGYTTVDNNDTWSITLPDDLVNSVATNLGPGGTVPSARSEHSLIYDSANQRMILFAGWGAAFYNTVYSLSLTSGSETWSTPTISGTPPSIRSSHVAVYDPVTQRMVITHGREQIGANWYFRNDVYSLAIPTGTTFTWTNNTAPTGSLPSKRYGSGAVYDSVNRRMIMFGGLDEVLNILSNETICYDLSVTSGILYAHELYPTVNLKTNDGSVAVYDSQNKQMIRYGGYGRIYDTSNPEATGYHHSEVWAYTTDQDSSSYNFLNNITPSVGPLAGEVSAIVYDTTYHRLVRFGSLGYNQDQPLNDTWGMSLDSSRSDYHVWKRFTTSGGPPAARWGAAAIYDSPNSRMIIFGGSEAGEGSTHYNDAWQLSLPDPDSNGGNPTYTWTQISASGTPPSSRFQSTGIYDPDNIRMLIFGGRTSTTSYLYELWELDWGANPNHNTFTWYNRTPGSNNPTGRRGHTTVYDSTYDRMIMFGGWDGSSTHFNDVWSLSTTTPGSEAWTSITTSGTPPVVRRSHTSIFDPVTQRMIIESGRGALTPVNFLDDFWELTLPSGTSGWTWSQLSPISHLKASVAITGLTNNTGYHWQAWATGSVSGDTIKVSYGSNAESASDFIIGILSITSDIKTVDGLAFEYVKTMNSLIVANVKSIDGLE